MSSPVKFMTIPVVPTAKKLTTTAVTTSPLNNYMARTITTTANATWSSLVDESRITDTIKNLTSEEKTEILMTLLFEYIPETEQNKIKALLKLNNTYDKKLLVKHILHEIIKTYLNDIEIDKG